MMAALRARGRTLGDLLGSAAGGYARLAITDLTLDSRQAGPGAAFVAVPGQREHGDEGCAGARLPAVEREIRDREAGVAAGRAA